MSTILTTIEIKGSKNITAIQKLFRENKTWHMPISSSAPGSYNITLKTNDPMTSFLQLRYQ